ncbi:MAG: hypothetical protein ACRDYB_15725, partial [Acidimicrobiales bacterium]
MELVVPLGAVVVVAVPAAVVVVPGSVVVVVLDVVPRDTVPANTNMVLITRWGGRGSCVVPAGTKPTVMRVRDSILKLPGGFWVMNVPAFET